MYKTVAVLVAILGALPIIVFILHDSHIDIRLRLLHYPLQGAFWQCGVVPGHTVNRQCVNTLLDIPHNDVGYDARTNTLSQDIFVPYQLNGTHTIRVRVFYPKTMNKAIPALVFNHGGGLVIGNATAYDDLPRALAQKANIMVFSVDYRLAPEHPFPAAIYDVYSVLRWLTNAIRYSSLDFIRNIDPNQLYIGGECAGGSLALLMTYIARDRVLPVFDKETQTITDVKIDPLVKLQKQVLMYPFLPEETEAKQMTKTYVLTPENMRHLWYTATKDFSSIGENKLLHPYKFKPLSALPEAIVITPSYSLLRDDGATYAKKLEQAGVPVSIREFPVPHSFMQFPSLPESKAAMDWIVEQLLL
jgi:acetyl esterase